MKRNEKCDSHSHTIMNTTDETEIVSWKKKNEEKKIVIIISHHEKSIGNFLYVMENVKNSSSHKRIKQADT